MVRVQKQHSLLHVIDLSILQQLLLDSLQSIRLPIATGTQRAPNKEIGNIIA